MVLLDEWHLQLFVHAERPDAGAEELTRIFAAAVREAVAGIEARLTRSGSELRFDIRVER